MIYVGSNKELIMLSNNSQHFNTKSTNIEPVKLNGVEQKHLTSYYIGSNK
jgi:hypothetical protein